MSFNAAIASSSGALIRVGPKTMPRFSALIRFSFSWSVTLQKKGQCFSHSFHAKLCLHILENQGNWTEKFAFPQSRFQQDTYGSVGWNTRKLASANTAGVYHESEVSVLRPRTQTTFTCRRRRCSTVREGGGRGVNSDKSEQFCFRSLQRHHLEAAPVGSGLCLSLC